MPLIDICLHGACPCNYHDTTYSQQAQQQQKALCHGRLHQLEIMEENNGALPGMLSSLVFNYWWTKRARLGVV